MGSRRRSLSSLPRRTMRPTSTSRRSLAARKARVRAGDAAAAAAPWHSWRSCSHCSSTERWKTAETRRRVICSVAAEWMRVQDAARRTDSGDPDPPRSASAAATSCSPYS